MPIQTSTSPLTVLVSARIHRDRLWIYGSFRADSLAAYAAFLQDLAAKEPVYVNTGIGETIKICYETYEWKDNRCQLQGSFVQQVQFEMNNLLNFLESAGFTHVLFEGVTPSRMY